MRIAIMGTGGVGGYFGGRLAAAGADVTFIARGAHLAALRGRGLQIRSPKGDLTLPPVQATDAPAEVGPVDVVLFTVKMYDVDEAARAIAPMVGDRTTVVTLQNGVEAVDMVARHAGAAHVAGGVAYVAAVIDAPGVIRHTALDTLVFGALPGKPVAHLEALRDAGVRAGFQAVLTDQVESALWAKFARLSVFSGMTAITRQPIGVLREDPDLFAMLNAACEEAIAVGRARGVALPAGLMDEILQMVHDLPYQARASMLEDLERGKRLELPWLSGAVVRLGREVGVPTPIHQFVATVLKPYTDGQPAASAPAAAGGVR